MTVEVRLSYKAIALGVKVTEHEVYLRDGTYRKRFSVEVDNPLWPFGVANFKTSTPDGDVSVLVIMYLVSMGKFNMRLLITSVKRKTYIKQFKF